MKKKKWAAALLSVSLLQTLTANAEYQTTYQPLAADSQTQNIALPWWDERDTLSSLPAEWLPYPEAAQQAHQGFIAPEENEQHLRPVVKFQQINYPKNPARKLRNALNCKKFNIFNLPAHCIKKSAYNRQGLYAQLRYLNRKNPAQRVAGKWANISNAALLETVNQLLDWEQGSISGSLQSRFHLREIHSYQSTGKADYTGYFTPILQVQSYPDQRYRYPIYASPPNGTHFNRAEIDRGALNGRNLEIGWTDDKINLFFAQIQGSAIAQYPNGQKRYLDYTAHNNHGFQKIDRFLNQQGYTGSSFSHANIGRWLRANPHKIDPVLHYNPRYIFFRLSNQLPITANGSTVLPGHTLAVDANYIPLGAVLLAEIPRMDHNGQQIGRDWRLLFAQDNGAAIKGPGRLDLYTGSGKQAEQKTYHLTGLHRTYLLLPKLSHNVAGM